MPAPTFADLFRTLASFSPSRVDLSKADWEPYVEWAIGNGLAPLAAYNLEYRLGGAGAPEWARDRLLTIYQGSLNDNVMKLVNFKRSVDALEGRQVVLLGAASLAEALYPHVAFRPVIDLHCWVPLRDVGPFASFLARAEFKPEGEATKTRQVVSDGRTQVTIHGELFPKGDQDVFGRALPFKVYGPSFRRLDHADAVLAHAYALAQSGFEVPTIEWLDLRELVTGATSVSGPYSQPLDPAVLLERAKQTQTERPLWAALQVLARLFPEVDSHVGVLSPQLSLPVRTLLDATVVGPASELGRTRVFKGEDVLRALLSGA